MGTKWTVKIRDLNASEVDYSDRVNVALSIGGYEGLENIMLDSKNKDDDKYMYKRKPKVSCYEKDRSKD